MMADTALSDQVDSGKAERVCAWCGADISQRHARTKFCGVNCKQSSYRRKMGKEGRLKNQAYNKRYYAENANRLKAQQREWNDKNREHRKIRDKAYYEANADHRRKKQREWLQRLKRERPDEYREHLLGQRERQRRRDAQAALSMLILPIEEPSQ